MIKLTAKAFLFCVFVLFGSQAYAATCVGSFHTAFPRIPAFEELDVDNNQILSEQEQNTFDPKNPCQFTYSLHKNLVCKSIRKKYDTNHDGLYSKEEYLLWQGRYKRYFEIDENLGRLSGFDRLSVYYLPATDEIKFWLQQEKDEVSRLSLRNAGDTCEPIAFDM